MQRIPLDKLLVPTCPPKDSSILMGYAYCLDGKLYYVDGKNRVYLNEHFENTQSTVTDLIENTIRYEAKNAG